MDTEFLRRRAGLVVAVAEPRGLRRTRLLMGAASDANVRGRRRSVVQNGTALLVEAGIAIARDRPETALSRLDAAGRNFETAEAKLMIATVRYCQGRQGVRTPARWVSWMACGFRAVLGAAQ